jgi:outer membrane protein assembly factor BamD
MKRKKLVLFLFLLALLINSCSFRKVLKGDDAEKKYDYAVKLYNEKDYSRALQLFDQLIGVTRATEKSERIYYYYAYCYFNQRDYTLSSYYFKRYCSNFPNTKTSEECAFMGAYCNYLNSPDFTLDQTSTYDAIKDLQLFINMYPKSSRVSESNDLIDKLREKLESKDFRIAKMYFRMQDYTAAITSLSNILKDYPDTRRREEIMFLIFKSYHKYAIESIENKKKERHLKAISAYNDFIAQYPESTFLDEAKGLRVRSQKELEKYYQKDEKINSTLNKNN